VVVVVVVVVASSSSSDVCVEGACCGYKSERMCVTLEWIFEEEIIVRAWRVVGEGCCGGRGKDDGKGRFDVDEEVFVGVVAVSVPVIIVEDIGICAGIFWGLQWLLCLGGSEIKEDTTRVPIVAQCVLHVKCSIDWCLPSLQT